MLKENYFAVIEKIKLAEHKSRYGQKVSLLAVSKTHPVEAVQEIYETGQRDFAENKVQELLLKRDRLPCDIRWHLIGHLQTNKVKSIVGKVYMIHSVDSYKLAAAIDRESEKQGIKTKILIEINIGNEESKSGIKIDETAELLRSISGLKNIDVLGLMCIPPVSENPEDSRLYFKALKDLSIDINALNIDNIKMEFLSMGMSSDYAVAIEEGADFVRVGTGIFGKRNYMK